MELKEKYQILRDAAQKMVDAMSEADNFEKAGMEDKYWPRIEEMLREAQAGLTAALKTVQKP